MKMSGKTRLTVLFGSLCLSVAAVGCSGEAGEPGLDGADGQDGHSVTIVDIEPGEECENGGQKIVVGYTLDADGNVDEAAEDSSTHYVCEGAPGPEGPSGEPGDEGPAGADGREVVAESREATLDECEFGGTHVTFGYADEDGNLDTDAIVDTALVCNGADGDSPAVTVAFEDLLDPSACESGSGTIAVFSVDGESIGSQVICDGVAGPAAREVVVETEALNDASRCDGAGGWDITFKYDDGEVIETIEVCNGGAGEGGTGGIPLNVDVQTILPDDPDLCTGVGGQQVTFSNENGQTVDSYVVCNGAQGEQGGQGEQGEPGCSVVYTLSGTSTDPEGRFCRDISVSYTGSVECAQQDAVEYGVCDGLDGRDILVASSPAGVSQECPTGGTEFTFYYANADGAIDEVVNTSLICNGADGIPSCGDTLSTAPIPAGDDSCVYGGTEVTVHQYAYDANQGECVEDVDQATSFDVCNGAGAVCQLIPFGQCSNVDFTDPNGTFGSLNGDLSNLNLRYINLEGATLTGVDLRQSDLTGANFTNAQMTNAELTGSTFTNANFSGAQLSGAGNLTLASTIDATYSATTRCPDTNLAREVDPGLYECEVPGGDEGGLNSQLRVCKLERNGDCENFTLVNQTLPSDLAGVNLSGTVFEGTTTLTDVDFGPSEVRPSRLADTDFTGAIVEGSLNLQDVDAPRVIFNNVIFPTRDVGADPLVNLQGANLQDAKFEGSTLRRVDFRTAELLVGADFTAANLEESNFANVLLVFANFTDAILWSDFSTEGVDFSADAVDNFNLVDTVFNGADVRNANFEKVRFYPDFGSTAEEQNIDPNLEARALFVGADLRGANFENAYIRHTVFAGSELENSSFKGARTGTPNTGSDTIFVLASFGAGADMTDANLRDANFEGITSTGVIDFTGSALHRARFDGADINIVAKGANLFNTSFVSANLVGGQFGPVIEEDDDGSINFIFTALNGTDFTNATLTGADLSYAVHTTSTEAVFNGANLTGADLRGTLLDVNEINGVIWGDTTLCPDFSVSLANGSTCVGHTTACRLFPASANLGGGCVNGFVDGITGAQSTDPLFGLAGRDLSGISFDGATLAGSDLSGTDFTGGVFTGADLSDADLTGSTLTGATLTGANLTNVDFTVITIPDIKAAGRFNETILNGADFTELDLAGVTLEDVVYHGTVFSGADLQGSAFIGDTDGAVFTGANLRNALFDGAIENVSFDVADLLGVDFTGSWLENVDFSLAKSLEPGTNDEEVQNVKFDNVLFTGGLKFGDRVIRGGSWGDAAVDATLDVASTLIFVTGTDLTGLCGLDATNVSFSSTPPPVICPDGDPADLGNTCRPIPACI